MVTCYHSSMQKNYDVIAIGNPLMDVEIRINEKQLSDLKLVKNSMTLIPSAVRDEYLRSFPQQVKYSSGGSVANTLYDLAKKSKWLNDVSDVSLALVGFVAGDDLGKAYRDELVKSNVDFLLPLLPSGEGYTGTSIVFITPDGSRTMRTTLGCASSLIRDRMDFGAFKRTKVLYLEGYILNSENNIAIVLEIIRLMPQDGLLAISCSDAFCILEQPEIFKKLLKQADVFFANEEEARAVLGYKRDEPIVLNDLVQEISDFKGKQSSLRVITAGEKGSYLVKGNKRVHISAEKVEVVDTTGAGDAFAAGIFYGLIKDLSLKEMGTLATKWASEVIAKMGARV